MVYNVHTNRARPPPRLHRGQTPPKPARCSSTAASIKHASSMLRSTNHTRLVALLRAQDRGLTRVSHLRHDASLPASSFIPTRLCFGF
ncbi:hypothetical protein ACFX13_028522 [Malus domestica]